MPLSRIAQRYVAGGERSRAAQSGVEPARDAARRLPLARDPDGSAPGRGARAAVELPVALRALAQAEQVSLFSLLCAAYGYVLARHAAQDEVAIGVVSAGRRTLDELSSVGMFARSVPLRLEIDAAASLLALARSIHERVPQLTRQDGEIHDATPLSATALFQHWDRAPFRVAGLELRLELDSPDGAPAGYSRSELELLAADFGDELTACLQYDPSVLRESTAAWLARATSHASTGGLRSRLGALRSAWRSAMARGASSPSACSRTARSGSRVRCGRGALVQGASSVSWPSGSRTSRWRCWACSRAAPRTFRSIPRTRRSVCSWLWKTRASSS
jgi:non-ribosomal peptide synthetase component F